MQITQARFLDLSGQLSQLPNEIDRRNDESDVAFDFRIDCVIEEAGGEELKREEKGHLRLVYVVAP